MMYGMLEPTITMGYLTAGYVNVYINSSLTGPGWETNITDNKLTKVFPKISTYS